MTQYNKMHTHLFDEMFCNLIPTIQNYTESFLLLVGLERIEVDSVEFFLTTSTRNDKICSVIAVVCKQTKNILAEEPVQSAFEWFNRIGEKE